MRLSAYQLRCGYVQEKIHPADHQKYVNLWRDHNTYLVEFFDWTVSPPRIIQKCVDIVKGEGSYKAAQKLFTQLMKEL